MIDEEREKCSELLQNIKNIQDNQEETLRKMEENQNEIIAIAKKAQEALGALRNQLGKDSRQNEQNFETVEKLIKIVLMDSLIDEVKDGLPKK